MGIVDKFIQRVRGADAAEKAELAGDLAEAVRLWTARDEPDEAARVMLLRGDAEEDPRKRLQHYTQAVATAVPAGETHRAARIRRAKLVVSLADGTALSAARRHDILEAATALEEAGETVAAADAFAMAGDVEGEARALTSAGEVDRLEALFAREENRDRRARASDELHAEIDALSAAGRRREALALAEAHDDDPVARGRAQRLRGAKITGPVVRVLVHGAPLSFVLGREVVVGRTEGTLTVASAALSRRHLALSRSADTGRFVARDLDSRNGTRLRGLDIRGEVEVGDGLLLSLGGEVPLELAPSAGHAGALCIRIGGQEYLAPLRANGVVDVGVSGWRFETGEDGWVSLMADSGKEPYAGALVLARAVTLQRGDTFLSERGGDVVLRVLE